MSAPGQSDRHETRSSSLAYVRLNLRHNPFGEATLEQRRHLALLPDTIPLDVISQKGYLLQVCGEVGCGKSSYLLALSRLVDGAVYIRCGPGLNMSYSPRQQLLVDEYDLVSERKRVRLLKKFTVKAVATHRDFSAEIKRQGYEVMTVNPAESMTPDLLERIVQQRLEWARRGPGPLPAIDRDTLAELSVRSNNNVRTVENLLYDRVQAMLADESDT